jgi:superfamily II DNA/RNA helicase
MAITLVSPKEQFRFRQIENFLQKDIYKIPLPNEIGTAPEYNPVRERKSGKQGSSKKKKTKTTSSDISKPQGAEKNIENPSKEPRKKHFYRNHTNSSKSRSRSDKNQTGL